MDYTQTTATERDDMLAAIGVDSIDQLFSPIPPEYRFDGLLNLPTPASELTLQRDIARLAATNRGGDLNACFMGAGAYDHFVPVLIDQLILRGEYLTAYTPYQAEASQGSLQAFFEFQTQIARLTRLEVANASLYEGATAVAEAALLALGHTGKRRVVISGAVHPDSRRVLATYLDEFPVEVITVAPCPQTGRTRPEDIRQAMTPDTACVIVQSPNFYGIVEDWAGCFEVAHSEKKTLAVAVFNPIACGLLKAPGECGADIAVGEGQPLGIPLQYGGPYLGLFAATRDLQRKMPGRLVGETTDADGRRAFCLALQTREQHIRREKATSNICTNQGLLALRATMFLNTLGPQGLAEMAEQCWHKAHYLAEQICALDGFSLKFDARRGAANGSTPNFFHEFVVTCPRPAREVMRAAREAGYLLGPALDDRKFGDTPMGTDRDLLVAVTEKRTRDEIDGLIDVLKGIKGS